jgi:hypothetical protein
MLRPSVEPQPAVLDETSGRRVESCPSSCRASARLSTSILRVARASLVRRPGGPRLVTQDGRLGECLAACRGLAGLGERGFVMISAWPDWASIEAATGASIADPLRTKRVAGLEDFHADHYELLQDEPGLAARQPEVGLAPADRPRAYRPRTSGTYRGQEAGARLLAARVGIPQCLSRPHRWV